MRVVAIPEQAQVATPPAPIAGYGKLYQKTDGDYYSLDSLGVERFCFSPRFELFQSLGVSTTTLAAFQDKVTGTTGVLAAGTYEVTCSYGWNYNGGTTDFVSRLLVDGSPVEGALDYHRQEPQDVAGAVAGTGSDQAHGFTRVDYVVLTAGTHTVNLQWAAGQAGVNSSIWSAKVALKRVL